MLITGPTFISRSSPGRLAFGVGLRGQRPSGAWVENHYMEPPWEVPFYVDAVGPSSRGTSLDLWTPGGIWRVWDRYPGLFLLHWAQDSHLGTFASLTCNVASWSIVLCGIVSILKAASRAKPSFLNDARDIHVHTCMQLHTQKHTDSFTQAVRE